MESRRQLFSKLRMSTPVRVVPLESYCSGQPEEGVNESLLRHTMTTALPPSCGARMEEEKEALRTTTQQQPHPQPQLQCQKRIGILTGGGDCPGLNAVIRAACTTVQAQGHQLIGLYDGFEGKPYNIFKIIVQKPFTRLHKRFNQRTTRRLGRSQR